MKNVAATLFLSAIAGFMSAQIPQFQKFAVSETGCTAYFPGDPNFELTWSEDSSKVYTGEFTSGDFTYALICVELKDTLAGDKTENKDLLESYLDFLQVQFDISNSAGYGEGHTMETNPEAVGVIDFWVDTDGNNWNVKGWIDNQFIAVLCIYGIGEVNYNYSEIFLNGFRFR